jgi:hypothetical protein
LGPVITPDRKIILAKAHLAKDKPGEIPLLNLMKDWKFVPDESIPCMNFKNVGSEPGVEYQVGFNPDWIKTARVRDIATIIYHFCYHLIYQRNGEKNGKTR